MLGYYGNAQNLIDTWPICDPVRCYLDFYSNQTINVDTTNVELFRVYFTVGIAVDNLGELLFQCNGSHVVNKNLSVIDNGDSITDNHFYTWAYYGTGIPQSVIALPRSNNTYWLFYYSYDSIIGISPSPDRLYYAMVDMNANGGAGRVTIKKQAIYKGVMGDCRLTACRHANGRDWWLVNHAYGNNIYNKWLVTPDSIYGPMMQAIGAPDAEPDLIGSAQFSMDGKKYASGTIGSPMNIMDFDRCTGMFSNPKSIKVFSESPWTPSATNSIVDALCFSPSGRYLYVTSLYYVLQYDTWADTIENTRTLIVKKDSTYMNSEPFFTMAISLFNEIIIANYQGNAGTPYHVIHYPDRAGMNCNFQKEAIFTAYYVANYYLPNLANLKLGAMVGVCDTITASPQIPEGGFKDRTHVFPNPASEYAVVELSPLTPEGGTNTKLQVQVVNVMGQTVYRRGIDYDERSILLKVNNFANGVYLVTVSSEHEIIGSCKFMKQ